MILTHDEILKLKKNKDISIKPFKMNNLGPASYDITLSNEFRIFKKGTIDLKKSNNYKKFTKKIKSNKITLKPNEFILGISKEQIILPKNICGHITGRSTYARFGIAIHISSDFIQPGVNNKQVLEILNVSNNDVILYANTKIAQIIFQECKGNASYKGKYQNQIL